MTDANNNPDKKNVLIFRVSAGIFSLQMLMSAGMYIFKNDMAVEGFTHIGYPTYLIYPLALAKILGLLAIWSNKSAFFKNLAYAGFFYNMLLATSGHIVAGDGIESAAPAVALLFMLGAFHFDRKLNR